MTKYDLIIVFWENICWEREEREGIAPVYLKKEYENYTNEK